MPHDALTSAKAVDRSNEAAAPPLYGLAIVLIPIGAAVFVASTRFTDNKHAGFDIIFASVEGIICAWLAFRWYHLPVRRGAGWAWGPRRSDAAFGIGVGTGSYGKRNSFTGKHRSHDHHFAAGREHTSVEMDDLATIETTGGSYHSQRPMV
jgi:hypothetical protein